MFCLYIDMTGRGAQDLAIIWSGNDNYNAFVVTGRGAQDGSTPMHRQEEMLLTEIQTMSGE